jgi:predicted ATPase
VNAEQYARAGQLFHAALELPRAQRPGYLASACAADEALQREVESLLEAHEQAGDFAAGPPVHVAASWPAAEEDAAPLTGTVESYEVLSRVGRGGMGEVYLAQNTRLGRKVALKLLRPALTGDADAVRRFEQEARAASSLNHPNIVTIYEVGELLGRRYLAMEYVEGRSLAVMAGPVDTAALTGPGGTGKTRPAIRAALDLPDHFDSVSFVDLASIDDPRLVAFAVAGGIGVRESGDVPLTTAIVEHLRGLGRALLLVDNFEQVSDAAAVVRELLDACPALQVLVTSRVALHIYGEHEFPVPPLPLPAEGALFSPSTLVTCPSIALFVQRATAVRPDFVLTPRTAGAVVEICRRLDGLPLAIELAAARIKVLPPGEVLLRIERPLELLTGGARDMPARQQTLRQAIKWSYDLLTPAEQRLFRRLSVFAGGCTLEAVEAVCDTSEDLGVGVLDGITALVDSSLLARYATGDGDPRFVLLETFREYGREQLLEQGDGPSTDRAHAAYMLVLAEEERLEMSPSQREAWLRTCDAEHDNFRAAMRHLIACGDAEWALRLGAALFRFWEQRDHLTEGRETLARVLALPGAAPATRLRARALYGAAVLADVQSDSDAAEALSREACGIYREFGDASGVATTMTVMAFQAQRRGRYADAVSLFGETTTVWKTLGDTTAVNLGKSNMANAARAGGDFALARELLDEVVASSQSRGDVRGVASALNGLGDVAGAMGDHDGARAYHHQSLARYRQVDDRWGAGDGAKRPGGRNRQDRDGEVRSG